VKKLTFDCLHDRNFRGEGEEVGASGEIELMLNGVWDVTNREVEAEAIDQEVSGEGEKGENTGTDE
jgi:hypothetical protein